MESLYEEDSKSISKLISILAADTKGRQIEKRENRQEKWEAAATPLSLAPQIELLERGVSEILKIIRSERGRSVGEKRRILS